MTNTSALLEKARQESNFKPIPLDPSSRETVDNILRDFKEMEGVRGIWESHWEEIARLVIPSYSTVFNTVGSPVAGEKRNQSQYDSTASAALRKFCAAMESTLTPANNKWHYLRPSDRSLLQRRDVAMWFDHVNDSLFHYRYSPKAGFQANQGDGYYSLGAFGTSCLFIDAYKDPLDPYAKGLRYKQIPISEVFFSVNHQGQVDTAYRRYKMTLRQLAHRWGVNSLPEDLGRQLLVSPETEKDIIHAVRPRKDWSPSALTSKGYKYASFYILREKRLILEESGYRCFPYSVARYSTAPGEIYGRSPAMEVLPAIKTLQEQKKTNLLTGHRAHNPVLLAHDDGVLNGVDLSPGAINYGGVNADGRLLIQALPTGSIQVGKDLMDDERQTINDAFLVTLFQILVDTPQMTATEVLERAREKGALLSPTMGRFQAESLGPMIEREFDLLLQQGLIEPPPQILLDLGAEYRVEYDAPLNRAMRADEASGIMRSMQFAAEIQAITQDPSVMDWFDMDAIIPEMVQINGAPMRFISPRENVEALRQNRQQEKAAAQLTQALPGIAAMTKAVGQREQGGA